MRRSEFTRARKQQDLTQQQLADLLRVHPQTVSKWERGDQAIPGLAELVMKHLDVILACIRAAERGEKPPSR